MTQNQRFDDSSLLIPLPENIKYILDSHVMICMDVLSWHHIIVISVNGNDRRTSWDNTHPWHSWQLAGVAARDYIIQTKEQEEVQSQDDLFSVASGSQCGSYIRSNVCCNGIPHTHYNIYNTSDLFLLKMLSNMTVNNSSKAKVIKLTCRNNSDYSIEEIVISINIIWHLQLSLQHLYCFGKPFLV